MKIEQSKTLHPEELVKGKIFRLTCRKCGLEVLGTKNEVLYNFQRHWDAKHGKEKKKWQML